LFPGLADVSGELTDFGETAALIANLDLVITVDTAMGHLTGAMGKPVWIMVPKASDWRWLLDRSDSPWYPTARLFRQQTPGEWDPVIAEVTAALAAELRAGAEGIAAD
jgi:ADP-heptose:LPS heptosyltransferase